VIDHHNLPSVNTAKLPETYQAAKNALANCADLDECQSWADKAEALASYARQAEDDGLRKMADRIQARAIRRAGELLKQIPPAHGANQNIRAGALPIVSRTQAADDAGMSHHQRRQAIRVATVPDDDFERQIESDSPPTVTSLANQGKRPIIDLKGRDPTEFNRAMHFVSFVEHYSREVLKKELSIIETLNDSERQRVRKAINAIDSIHDQIITRI